MIKKTILALAALLCMMNSVQAQLAKDCFRQIPDSLCPLLSKVNRADFIDFLESDMRAEVTNAFGQKSEMTRLTDSFIEVRLSKQSIWQMKLLAVNDSTRIICTVDQVSAPAIDSHIRFFTTGWKVLPTETYLPDMPAVDDFFTAPADSTLLPAYERIRQTTDMTLLKADLSADKDELHLTFTTPDYLSEEETEKMKPYLKPAWSMHWSNGQFKTIE